MKQYPGFLKYSIFFFSGIIMMSCYGPRKARVLVDKIKNETEVEMDQLKLSTQKMQQAFSDERIDSTIKNRVIERLNKYALKMDSVNGEIAMLEKKLVSRKHFRKNFADSIRPKIALLEAHIKGSQLRLQRYNMLTEALDIAKQNPFGLAAFFGPGKYTIPQENYQQASLLFMPAIDSLIVFSNKYPGITRTATLVVNGYADGQAIDSSSELYHTLLQYLKKEAADKSSLNWALSELRSHAISGMLDTLLKQKQSAFLNLGEINFSFYAYGQGETYPSKKITNYQLDDERRRIVLVYWSVIPD